MRWEALEEVERINSGYERLGIRDVGTSPYKMGVSKDDMANEVD